VWWEVAPEFPFHINPLLPPLRPLDILISKISTLPQEKWVLQDFTPRAVFSDTSGQSETAVPTLPSFKLKA